MIPTLTTTAIISITATTASSGGNITDDGGASVTARGVCWSTSQNPTIADSYTTDGSGTGSFISNISGLTENTTYYVRAYATNSAGTVYGDQQSFTTLASVTTTAISNITATTASGGGFIATGGGASITARGVCWSTSTNPTIADSKTTDGTGTGSFTSSLIRLTSNTTYFVRAYAINGGGTAYGNQESFTTDPATVSDVDGNVYNVIRIGTQLWIKENLKTTKYNDETGTTHWASPNTGATNSSGFTALPGGGRSLNGTFYNMGNFTYFWSSSEYDSLNAWIRILNYNNSDVTRGHSNKDNGFSVRCLRD